MPHDKLKPWTAESLLALTPDELIRLASEKFVPKPWKHESFWHFSGKYRCRKCDLEHEYDTIHRSGCPVPDPIKLDWNTAMEWRDKLLSDAQCEDDQFRFIAKMEAVGFAIMGMWRDGDGKLCFDHWLIWKAQPRHYIIAAILAQEKK